MKRFRWLCLLILCSFNVLAQDTVVVQTLTFDSTWTRRGKWVFPPATEKYRKILMYHTLKCFPGLSGDGKYACGEWDYLTYTFVYDNKGVLDSTYKSRFNYTINGSTPDSFPYTNTPVWDRYRRYQKNITRTATSSLVTAQVGTTGFTYGNVFGTAQPKMRSQYLWKASELASAGLTAGNLTGIRLKLLTAGAAINNLRIKMRHYGADSLTSGRFIDSLIMVYDYQRTFTDTGWKDFQFVTPFTWNGTNNILVEISFDNGSATGAGNFVEAETVGFSAGLVTSGVNTAMNFLAAGDFIDLGRSYQITGAGPRTIECWAYTRGFNDGGLFQAGQTDNTGKDFSFRTTGTNDVFRAQTWGATDLDATLKGSKTAWHHYAMSYDGSTVRIYYDGQPATSKVAALNTGAGNILLGRWNGIYFNGKLDNFRVWNKAISDSVMALWYNKPVSGHPDASSLLSSYEFEEGSGQKINDGSGKNQPAGTRNGSAWWSAVTGDELFFDAQLTNVRPLIIFEKGVYTSQLDSVLITDSVMRAPRQVIQYNNAADGKQINDNAANHPSLPTDTLHVWAAGYSYTYNPNGSKADSTLIPVQNTLRKTLKVWYSNNVVYEIGRFITPYGINLNMGNGFRWVYDVTDYAQLLHDTVDLSAGNNQELIDVKFIMIKGDPPAEVNRIVHLSDKGAPGYSYRDLDDDKYMKAQTIDVKSGTSALRIKTRLTGHGHNSNDGSYPHCCEWKDNMHYLYANGTQVAGWKVFRYTECSENPLYPQGGTWPGAREGWCPGDKVQDYEFDLSDKVVGGKITLDYDIEPVPSGNLGMGGGNYVFTMHLIEYKQPKFTLDGEMYEIISPNNHEYYSRKNPVCIEPKVVVRNAGSTPLTSITISYGISGGPQQTYTWTGNLKFLDMATVTLPVPDGSIWVGDGTNKFTATVTKVNGVNDANSANNTANTYFNLPVIFPGKIMLNIRTNNVPSDNKITVRDVYGATIFTHSNMAANTNYFDTLDLGAGCYTLEVEDLGQDGLSYWANTAAGNGLFRIRNGSGALLKTFNADFGGKIFFAFGISKISNVKEEQAAQQVDVYPNPSNGQFTVMTEGLKGSFTVEVYNSSGQLVRSETMQADGLTLHPVQIHPSPGVYLVRVSGNEKVFTQKLLVQ